MDKLLIDLMPRKQCQRRVGHWPGIRYFKPQGIPLTALLEIQLTVDELEALRLADYEGHYHSRGGDEMDVSRQTFGRILESARRKVAEALIQGKALRIEGGEIEMREQRTFICRDCSHRWPEPYGTGRPAQCPSCQSKNIQRDSEERGRGRGHGVGQGRGCRARAKQS